MKFFLFVKALNSRAFLYYKWKFFQFVVTTNLQAYTERIDNNYLKLCSLMLLYTLEAIVYVQI
jgi:hypothetical protein